MVANSFPDDYARKVKEMRRKLEEIRSHDGDHAWFGKHESSTRNTVRRAIDIDPVYREATATLFICLNNLGDHKAYTEWAETVTEGLLVASTLGDTQLQASLWLAYGEFMLRLGQRNMASRTAEICTAFLADRSTPEDDMRRARAALLLICAQQPLSDAITTEKIIDQVLRFTEQANKPDLTARVYQILAHIYLFQGDLEIATDYALRSKELWMKLQNQPGIVDCLLNLARIARLQNRYDEVDFLLNQIQIDPDLFNGHQQYVNRMYEMGVLRLQTGHLERAEDTLHQLEEYLKTINSPRELAFVRQALALSQIAQHHFEQANENLSLASKTWSDLHYTYGQVEVYVARSYFERKRGRRLQAMQWLDEAEELCKQIENDALRKQILDVINGERGAWDK